MKKIIFAISCYLVLFFIPITTFAQAKCDDLSCLPYLLATDPTTPAVAEFIKKFGGQKFVYKDASMNDASFIYSTEAHADRRQIINSVYVENPKVLQELAELIGYTYDYEEGRQKYRMRYPKVKKKYLQKVIYLNEKGEFQEPSLDFSDCWRGQVEYHRVNGKSLVVTSIRFQIIKGYEQKAINYNPVGWHTFDPIETLRRTKCTTGNCVVCCFLCQTDGIKGVSKERDPNTNGLSTSIDVLDIDIPLPLKISKTATYQDLSFQFGEYQGVPWEKPEEEKNVLIYHSGDGMRFYFEEDKLVRISSRSLNCTNEQIPQEDKPVEQKTLSGNQIPNSPGIIEYKSDYVYTYYGELKNGIPHGHGALTRPLINEDYGIRKVIYPNYYQDGRFAGYKKLSAPICLSGDCSEKGIMLTSLGIYEGPVKSGIPTGSGKLTYTVDIDWGVYEGTFKNGLPFAEEGEIIFVDGRKYKGRIENGKPNGNGTIYNNRGKKESEGWYEDGIRRGDKHIKPKPKPTSKYAYDPKKQNWKDEYLPFMVFQLTSIKGTRPFGILGDNFYKAAVECTKWEYEVSSVDYMYDCLGTSYRTHLWGKIMTSYNLIDEVWHELDITFELVACRDSDLKIEVELARAAFEKFAFHANNIDNQYEAIGKQLKLPTVQSDYKLAKIMYDKGVSALQSYTYTVDIYYNDFVTALAELNDAILKQGCSR